MELVLAWVTMLILRLVVAWVRLLLFAFVIGFMYEMELKYSGVPINRGGVVIIGGMENIWETSRKGVGTKER